MENAYRLGVVEEVIYELDMVDVPDDILECEEDYQIVISGWWVVIPELGIQLQEGVYCNYDSAEEAYLPDFAVTVIKEAGEEGWIYFEQDGFVITLSNWLKGEQDISTLEQMWCYIQKPEEDNK